MLEDNDYSLIFAEFLKNIIANSILIIALGGMVIAFFTLIKNYIITKNQTKISSAHLILKLNEPWTDKYFKRVLEKITKNETLKDHEIEKFVNNLENIGIFWDDKTITDNHVKEFFGANIKLAYENAQIIKFINEFRKKNEDYYFTKLSKLFNKLDKWKI